MAPAVRAAGYQRRPGHGSIAPVGDDRVRVAFSVAEDLPLVCCDFAQLARAFTNLVENALAYSPPDTAVVVGAEQRGEKLAVWVEDRGPGVSDSEKASIFDKFYRGAASERRPAGTGLGLAITREIVRTHGATLRVEDAEPNGARFVVSLPLAACRTERERVGAPEKTARVLVVDDEEQIRRALRSVLQRATTSWTRPPTPSTGLEQAAAHTPDVIILDLTLPGMSGLEACKRLRDWYQGPILILSVRDSDEDKIAALDLGADDYLTKPFSTGELLARLRALQRRARGSDITPAEIRVG